MDTYKNQGDECNKRLQYGLACEGPYPAVSWTRLTNSAPDRDFYRFYDYSTISRPDPLIQSGFDYDGLASLMRSFRGGGANRWLRIFFEDQPRENLEAVQQQPSTWHARGIDFNDFIFDARGEGVKFTIDGSGISCDTQ